MFEVIGEKINGTRKTVGTAVVERDAELIRSLAVRQAEAGASWIDVNAGTRSDREPDDLIWLVETVQAVTEVPLCLDSANPEALKAAIGVTARTPLLNSISGEAWRLESVLPLAAQHGCPVIALALDADGIPTGKDGRLAVISRLIEATREAGLPDSGVYVDPLVMTISTDITSALTALDTIRAIRELFPQVHITSGLSNISFGLPARQTVNRAFLTLAMAAGQDSAILDPLDRELRAAMIATELLLGRDRHCRGYTKAYRAGLLGGAPAAAPAPATATA
ncbi:MAG TPA: dihydropteroate synthase [Kineosporiaceae bacterium]|nr:dihydropteroate synthase [Kineosporiaceae bacterium]